MEQRLILGSSRMARNMVRGSLCGVMGLFMKESLSMDSLKGMGYTTSRIVKRLIKDSLLLGRLKAMGR